MRLPLRGKSRIRRSQWRPYPTAYNASLRFPLRGNGVACHIILRRQQKTTHSKSHKPPRFRIVQGLHSPQGNPHLIIFLYLCTKEDKAMDIKKAEFLMSNTRFEFLPNDNIPEYAFIGRSNVGKSSLINMLVQRRGLAKTSSVPGKTVAINHFIVNDAWYLVDLPGYGYAQHSKKTREQWRVMINNYITRRRNLVTTFVLIDSRIEPQNNDLGFVEWLGENQMPFCIVFTKADKVSKAELDRNVEAFKAKLLEEWEELPPLFITSAEKKTGRDEVLNYIEAQNAEIADLMNKL